MIAVAVGLVVLVAAALSTKIVTIQDAEAAESVGRFDPVEYADARFDSEIVPQIEAEAVELATLLQDLEGGADEADSANTPGAGSSYSFPVGVQRRRRRSERFDPAGGRGGVTCGSHRPGADRAGHQRHRTAPM